MTRSHIGPALSTVINMALLNSAVVAIAVTVKAIRTKRLIIGPPPKTATHQVLPQRSHRQRKATPKMSSEDVLMTQVLLYISFFFGGHLQPVRRHRPCVPACPTHSRLFLVATLVYLHTHEL